MKKSRSNASPAPLEAALAILEKSKTFLVGVSGGRDSMALLDALVRAGFHRLTVCHLDHGLRGADSAGDARFVRAFAKKHTLGFESARADTKAFASAASQSIEHAARDLRRAFFAECARKHRCKRILLAHHADDQIETCLHNFLRGSGAAGLAGMRAVTRTPTLEIIRPFLNVTRAEINEHIELHRVAFREDASNSQLAHTRNRIRQKLIPAIEKNFGTAFRPAILRAAGIFRAEDDWIEASLPRLSQDLNCQDLRKLPPALRARTVLRWLRSHRIPDAGFAETQRVLTLLDPATGPAKINLPGNHHARRREGKIFLEPARTLPKSRLRVREIPK